MGLVNQIITKMQRIACFRDEILRLTAVLMLALPHSARADTVTVFAASSLHDALGEIALAYEADSDSAVTLVFAASSSVARQVVQGAPADVVLLADQAWAEWLIADGAVASIMPFAGNRLVLIGRDVPAIDDSAQIEAILGDGVIAMAQVDAVPAGRYGKAALVSLGLWDALSPRVVQAANVRAALRFVERGEAPLGIGYTSDLIALPMLSQVYAFAPDTHPEIVYSGSPVTDQGVEFMSYIQSEAGQDILTKWGFDPVKTQ